MGEVETDKNLNINNPLDNDSSSTSVATIEKISEDSNIDNTSTAVTEYKEVEEPCVSLTIIGENRLTDTEVFIRRGIKYSIRAFFSAIVLTIMHMFM